MTSLNNRFIALPRKRRRRLVQTNRAEDVPTADVIKRESAENTWIKELTSAEFEALMDKENEKGITGLKAIVNTMVHANVSLSDLKDSLGSSPP